MVSSSALAAGGPSSPPAAPSFTERAFITWVVGLVGFASFISLAVNIWDKLKPKPPLHEQYAPSKHDHSDLDDRFARLTHEHRDALTPKTFDDQRRACAQERLTIRQTAAHSNEKIGDQLTDLRGLMTTKFDELDKRAEDRASGIYQRMEPVGQVVAANKRTIEQHLADHRAKGGGSHAG